MISYSQNFEDVILWRIFKNMDSPGFYVDIGAFHPETHSVTKWLYDNGWNGINIEPVEEYYNSFELHRQRDVNLNIAISSTSGSVDLFVVESTGLSTLNKEVSKLHTDFGLNPKTRNVMAETLESVLARHLHSRKEIHFLKVDTEGTEKEILSGNDWEQFRPWIVIVESIVPILETKVAKVDKFEFEKAGYSLAYFDGMNDFYVRNDKFEELREKFYPPCVLDRFQRVDESSIEGKAAAQNDALVQKLGMEVESTRLNFLDLSMKASYLRRQLENLKQTTKDLESANQSMKTELESVREELQRSREALSSVIASKSWIITKPIRVALNNANELAAKMESAFLNFLSIIASQLTSTRIGRIFIKIGSKVLPDGLVSRVAAETSKKRLNQFETAEFLYEERLDISLVKRMQERIEFWENKREKL